MRAFPVDEPIKHAAARHAAIRRQHQAAADERYARKLAAATRSRDTNAAAQKVQEPATFVPVVLPSNQRRLAVLPRRRRYRFTKRLLRLVTQSLPLIRNTDASAAVDSAEASWELPILGTACATCRGHCCKKGDVHAYLDAATIRRYCEKHPQADVGEIVAAYARCLPAESFVDSCVFHSALGCAMPPEMRSATCHATVCSGLIELHDRTTRLGQSNFFLAATHADHVVRSQFATCGPTHTAAAESESESSPEPASGPTSPDNE